MIRSRSLLLFLCVFVLAACGEQSNTSTVKSEMIDPGSPGAALLKKHCSSCHAPPKPDAHVAHEWPNVIYRMSEKLRLKGHTPMEDEEVRVLVEYLQKYAKS